MKFAFLITQDCNLACHYCYIRKRKSTINLNTAQKAVDYIFRNSTVNEALDIGFFGGEPLLEIKLLKEITGMIEHHPEFPNRKIEIQVTTNGTIFSRDIADFLNDHHIGMGISCDGIPSIQDTYRRYADGKPSSGIVEKNIIKAIHYVPGVMVNAVFTPTTLPSLPESIQYLYGLGFRRIFVNPDYSAKWSMSDVDTLHKAYNEITSIYYHWHEMNDPAFISMIDGKIMVILNEGYSINERCHMGKKEFAIAPNGNIFPCERLVGDGSRNEHCIGNIEEGIEYKKFCTNKNFRVPQNSCCSDCTLKRYCMNWCGCSNYFSTGNYNQAGPFICASEKAAINASFKVFQQLETKYGASVIEKITGNICTKQQLLNKNLKLNDPSTV